MRVSFKIILIVWLVLLSILGGLVYTAYSKLHPDALIALMKQQVERNYPGADLRVGSVDYRFALDFKLQLKNILLLRNEKKIGSIGEVEVKIPWWLFLTDSGSAQINITKLDIQLAKSRSRNKGASDSSVDKKVKVKFSAPSYLANAKYTLRAKDITLRDSEDSHRFLSLSKLLVREFQYGRTSVFELTLPIEINHNAAKYNSELWLFGDLVPEDKYWAISYRGEFKTRDMADKFQLEDLTIDGKAQIETKDFQVQSSLNFLIDKQLIGTGVVTATENALRVDLDFNKFPLSYLGIISEEIKNPYLPALEGYGVGKLSFQKSSTAPGSKLNSRLEFDGIMHLGSDMMYAGKWLLSFDNAKWETSFMTPNGEVSFFRRAIIDFESGTLVQFNEEVGFSGIEFQRALAPTKTFSQFRNDESPTYYSSTASFKDCHQGDKKINGEIKFGRSPDLTFYQVNLKEEAGSFKLDYQEKGDTEELSSESRKFSWEGYPILQPYFNAATGVMDGTLQGKWSSPWHEGEWKANLMFTKLTNPSGLLWEMQQKLLTLFSIDAIPSEVGWNVEVRKNRMDIKGLTLEGPETAKISGVLVPGPGPSQMTLSYPKNKRRKSVKKEITQFPL